MITLIPEIPENVAAFKASGEITKEDFENLVIPCVKAKVNTFQELNFLLLLDTDVGHFTRGAWFQDALLGLKNITKWNHEAVVSDSEGVQKFTKIFNALTPGEFKAFPLSDLHTAIDWCAKGSK